MLQGCFGHHLINIDDAYLSMDQIVYLTIVKKIEEEMPLQLR